MSKTATRPDLRQMLIAKQAELDETERDFAARLGVDVSSWFTVKNGREMGSEFLGAVLRAFPDCKDLVVEYLAAKPRRTRRTAAELSA